MTCYEVCTCTHFQSSPFFSHTRVSLHSVVDCCPALREGGGGRRRGGGDREGEGVLRRGKEEGGRGASRRGDQPSACCYSLVDDLVDPDVADAGRTVA